MTTWEQIDFLPSRYREQQAQRLNFVWRLLILCAYVGLLAVGSMVQRSRRTDAKLDLTRAKQKVAQAEALSNELATWQQRLKKQRTAAELIAYLQHPWPRTQILAAVLPKLPRSIHLNELRVQAVNEAGANVPAWQQPNRSGKEETKTPVEPPAMDLAQLQRERDAAATYIYLLGCAQNQNELHEFLHLLTGDKLFASVELISVESLRAERELQGYEFQARIKLRPGYGQAGGPSGPEESSSETVAADHPAAGPPLLSGR